MVLKCISGSVTCPGNTLNGKKATIIIRAKNEKLISYGIPDISLCWAPIPISNNKRHNKKVTFPCKVCKNNLKKVIVLGETQHSMHTSCKKLCKSKMDLLTLFVYFK